MRFLRRLIAAVVFLAGTRRQLRQIAPAHLAGGGPLMLLGVALGLALAGLWELTAHLTRPHLAGAAVSAQACAAAVCTAAWIGLACRKGLLAMIQTLAPRRRRLKWPALAAVAIAWALALNYAVRYWDPDWPTHLPPAAAWLWPRALYRAIMLAPVWGSWAMLVLPKFHPPTERTDPQTRSLAHSTSPLAAAVFLALPLAGSFIYLMFLGRAGRFVPPAAAVLAALGGGTILIRIRGRLCRDALLAANVLTQAAFMLAYLAVR